MSEGITKWTGKKNLIKFIERPSLLIFSRARLFLFPHLVLRLRKPQEPFLDCFTRRLATIFELLARMERENVDWRYMANHLTIPRRTFPAIDRLIVDQARTSIMCTLLRETAFSLEPKCLRKPDAFSSDHQSLIQPREIPHPFFTLVIKTFFRFSSPSHLNPFALVFFSLSPNKSYHKHIKFELSAGHFLSSINTFFFSRKSAQISRENRATCFFDL